MGVYAAGDVANTPIKQGGLSAQQADAAASAIICDLTGRGDPVPFERVLRARVLSDDGPHFLRRDLDSRDGADAAEAPLWWPEAKVYGRHLAPFLAGLTSLDVPRSRQQAPRLA